MLRVQIQTLRATETLLREEQTKSRFQVHSSFASQFTSLPPSFPPSVSFSPPPLPQSPSPSRPSVPRSTLPLFIHRQLDDLIDPDRSNQIVQISYLILLFLVYCRTCFSRHISVWNTARITHTIKNKNAALGSWSCKTRG